jgi:hypothetical protein
MFDALQFRERRITKRARCWSEARTIHQQSQERARHVSRSR